MKRDKFGVGVGGLSENEWATSIKPVNSHIAIDKLVFHEPWVYHGAPGINI
jgi:hypothetical protein